MREYLGTKSEVRAHQIARKLRSAGFTPQKSELSSHQMAPCGVVAHSSSWTPAACESREVLPLRFSVSVGAIDVSGAPALPSLAKSAGCRSRGVEHRYSHFHFPGTAFSSLVLMERSLQVSTNLRSPHALVRSCMI